MGGWCRTQTREEKGRQPSLPHYPKKAQHRDHGLSFNGSTVCNLVPTAGELWALP